MTPAQADPTTLANRVAAITFWFHTIELAPGVTTPGVCQPEYLRRAADIYFGMGVEQRSVLDVGAWDGYFSFAAEQRRASRVLAVDDFVWREGGHGDRAAFELAREVLNSRVDDRVLDIANITVDAVGQFDIVLFNGIVYHIFDPISALTQMAAIARHVLTVETYIDCRDYDKPAMVFYPPQNNPPGLPQNGWGPNPALMHGLLGRLGFETVLEFPTPLHEPDRRIFLAFKPGHPFGEFVDAHADAARVSPAEPSAHEREATALRGELASAREELASIKLTRTWRWTQPTRSLYGRLRTGHSPRARS